MKKTIIVFLIAAAPLCLFAQLPSYLPTDGLVGWWPFNGNANDESGNGNDGTVNGATLTSDRNSISNRSFIFSGSQSITVQHTNQFNMGSNFTVSIWFTVDNFNGIRTLINKNTFGNGNRDYFNIGILPNSGVVYTQFGDGNLIDNIVNPNPPSLNTWYNATMSVSDSVKLYINGQLIESHLRTIVPLENSENVSFGYWETQTTTYHYGKLDDIGIWNRALTQQEITALFTGVSNDNNNGGNTATTTVPAAISYQAVARNAQGQPLNDAAVQVRFTLLTDSLTGAAEYSESHSLTTNLHGLFTTAFGAGTAETGTFAAINWASGTKYLKVELDAGSGFVDMGTQQLLSVPYSMRSNTSAKAGTIENAGLPVYADNTAALAGGLQAGQMYRTQGGVLMIVY